MFFHRHFTSQSLQSFQADLGIIYNFEEGTSFNAEVLALHACIHLAVSEVCFAPIA